MNVWVIDMDSTRTFHAVTQGDAISRNPRFSPDGSWLAYQSNETGRMQVYVISYPDLSQKRARLYRRRDRAGLADAGWRALLPERHAHDGGARSVPHPRSRWGRPASSSGARSWRTEYGDRSYDVMPDGEHFLMFEANPAAAPELRVIRNWGAELKAQSRR